MVVVAGTVVVLAVVVVERVVVVDAVLACVVVGASVDVVVGVASVAWHEYEKLTRQLITLVLNASRDSIRDHLGKMMWDDAQRVSENSTELAMKKLAELGWTQETVDRYSDALARTIAQTLTGSLPEHR